MKKIIHLTAGLPRSGTTILQNILNQNKSRFYATETSGCLDTLFAIRNGWHQLIEHKAHPDDSRLLNVLRGALQGYYADIEQPVIFSKSRGWLAYLEFIENIIGEKAKVIVPVRPIVDILASFEVLYRNTSKTRQPPGEKEAYFEHQTIKGRCQHLMRPDQVVGLALNRLQDAIARGLKDRLHFVDFYQLTSEPEKTMRGIYDFLGEPYFDHDFDYVAQTTFENDDIHGIVNLHKIRNKVEPVKSKVSEILGQEIIDFYTKNTK